MNFNWFTPGFDPTSGAGTPTNAQLLQMWTDGKPAPGVGMIIWSQDAPDAVNYPDVAGALWGELDAGSQDRTGNFYWYDGANWQPFTLADGTLSGDAFADQTINVSKLVPGTALQVLRTKSIATNGTEWVDVSAIFAANLVPASSMQNAPTTGYILFSGVGGVFEQRLFDTLWNDVFSITNVPYTQIFDVSSTAEAGQVLGFQATGGGAVALFIDELIRDGQLGPSKLFYGTSQTTIVSSEVSIDGNEAATAELTLSRNVTKFNVALAVGQAISIAIHQTGAYTITGWDAAIKWSAGTAPVITPTAGKTDVITFLRIGDTIYGAVIQNY